MVVGAVDHSDPRPSPSSHTIRGARPDRRDATVYDSCDTPGFWICLDFRIRGKILSTPTEAAQQDPRNSKEHWSKERLRKYATTGVARAVHPKVTVETASRVLGGAGITRIADVTNLDRLGIPNFMSVRPDDLGDELSPGISYYNGKGLTPDDAHAGALMEAIERHAGERCSYAVVTASYRQLSSEASCVRLDDIVSPWLADFDDDTVLEWVCGYELLSESPVFVPLNCVVAPYSPVTGQQLFLASTNGLASGNSVTEALCHALCEIVERDAESMSLVRTRLVNGVTALLDKAGMNSLSSTRERILDLTSIPAPSLKIVEKMHDAGLKVILHDVSDVSGVSTVHCAIIDPFWNGPLNAHGGCGSHPDARIAVSRALTEAAQSRLTCIQGGREDLGEMMKGKNWMSEEDIDEKLARSQVVSFADLPDFQSDFIDEDLDYLIECAKNSGLKRLVAFDMTHADVNMPVVRIVAPEAETWAIFQKHGGRSWLGPRAIARLHEAMGQPAQAVASA